MENIYEKMVALSPERDPIFTAVENLTKPEEMKLFVRDCTEYYRQHGDSPAVRKTPEATVKNNIGYAVGYYDAEIANRWMSTIDGVSHPVFGRNIPFNDLKKSHGSGCKSGRK